jgi:predicted sulfurtransferase
MDSVDIYDKIGYKFGNIDWKYSIEELDREPFKELSVRRVDSVISCGKDYGEVDFNYDKEAFGGIGGNIGIHLNPNEFHNKLLDINILNKEDIESNKLSEDKPNGILLDVRNEFEYDIGHFNNSVSLNTYTYAESWKSIDKILEKASDNEVKPQILMYCTGGIRCEKASLYVKSKGFDDVFQLQGGIHRYLESYPTGGEFNGKNYVFDGRIGGANDNIEQDLNINDNDTVYNEIIGHCIKCNDLHDEYLDTIKCTACRHPVLYCPKCVKLRDLTRHSGEYHCYRHLHIKDIYFTKINHYTVDELNDHSNKLLDMINEFERLKINKQGKRSLKKQREKISIRINELTQPLSLVNNDNKIDNNIENNKIEPIINIEML